MEYVLITPAKNEAAYIEKTILSVISQSVKPCRWVIISDGSTDRTDSIVETYSSRFEFIKFLRLENLQNRGTPSKVRALRTGLAHLADLQYEFIGNLDADICLDPTYYERLCERMNSDVGLGIAGGLILEERGGEFRPRVGTNLSSVAHGAQLMRKACYELLEGYQPLKHGGEDWYAEVCARMHGWTTRTFPDLGVMHLRHSGSVDSWLRRGVREGMADYSLGTIPGFEILKCIRRAQEKPMMMVAFARLVGYFWLWSSREPRLAPKEVVAFLQREQRDRIRDMLKHPLGRWWSLGAQ